MSIVVAASIALLTGPTWYQDITLGEAIDQIRQARLDGINPTFGVLTNRNGQTAMWTFYQRPGPNGADTEWLVTERTNVDRMSRSRLATGKACPAIFDSILEAERMAPPQSEIRGARSDAPPGYVPSPPNLGPLHASYVLWTKGWTTDSEPVELTMHHLGSGPLVGWTDRTEARLSACWSAPEAP